MKASMDCDYFPMQATRIDFELAHHRYPKDL